IAPRALAREVDLHLVVGAGLSVGRRGAIAAIGHDEDVAGVIADDHVRRTVFVPIVEGDLRYAVRARPPAAIVLRILRDLWREKRDDLRVSKLRLGLRAAI